MEQTIDVVTMLPKEEISFLRSNGEVAVYFRDYADDACYRQTSHLLVYPQGSIGESMYDALRSALFDCVYFFSKDEQRVFKMIKPSLRLKRNQVGEDVGFEYPYIIHFDEPTVSIQISSGTICHGKFNLDDIVRL